MQENDVMDFYTNGDAGPRGRLNYTYFFSEKNLMTVMHNKAAYYKF